MQLFDLSGNIAILVRDAVEIGQSKIFPICAHGVLEIFAKCFHILNSDAVISYCFRQPHTLCAECIISKTLIYNEYGNPIVDCHIIQHVNLVNFFQPNNSVTFRESILLKMLTVH